MKSAAVLAAASFFFVSGLAASSVYAQSSAPATNAPPPPGMNDPGVKQLPPPPKVPDATVQKSAGGQNLPAMQDTGAAGDGKHMTLPDVSTHQEGDNQVEEYRRSGMLYMVVVTPKNGIPQSYTVDPDGTRHMQPGQAPVHPAMYKVLEWGKSKPAEASSSSDGG
ncbi:hypothetical protein HDE76_002516 [Rhodanobacter sp. ANJX3]|jgi:hypothetical protein|uniref:DUF2782 domain-containing protein n=1 Tax=unclassified Rhodanobacter TaxID=2621553 RepID=UPI0015CB8ADB|nr:MULTISPECIES: DUF2782 domain-containing protein [unclassified Rhodanobacter]MBB5359287.1 hypothetical protein [Rhodanobacter sp. ANJX3]NYE29961.1 hypothetical protein [Rhodanobacter sp. K2T2]